jgi:hypothetical protein
MFERASTAFPCNSEPVLSSPMGFQAHLDRYGAPPYGICDNKTVLPSSCGMMMSIRDLLRQLHEGKL